MNSCPIRKLTFKTQLKTTPKMTKKIVSQFVTMKKRTAVRSLVVTGIVLVSLASCKSTEHCDAYNGSRSFKKKRVAAVVRETPQSQKLS